MNALGVLGIAISAPGLPNWDAARAIFRGAHPEPRPSEDAAPPSRMNSRDRRRASDTVRLAVEIGFDAAASARLAPGDLPAVFASSHGEGAATHKLLAALTETHPFVSPTLFHNSVHNTPAGYWSIAAGTRAPTTSICAGRSTFAVAFMKAASIVTLDGLPALLVAYDAPFPDPLSRICPFPGPLGVALVVGPAGHAHELWRVALSLEQAGRRACSRPKTEGLGQLFDANPVGQCLPLLEALAAGADAPIVLDFGGNATLAIEVEAREPR